MEIQCQSRDGTLVKVISVLLKLLAFSIPMTLATLKLRGGVCTIVKANVVRTFIRDFVHFG